MKAANFIVKIFDLTGVTLKTVFDSEKLLTIPVVTREVNKPASDVTINVAQSWNDSPIDVATQIQPYDLVKIYAITEANPLGYLVFQGNVQEQSVLFSAVSNSLTLRVFPIDSEMTFFFSGLPSEPSTVQDVFTYFFNQLNGAYSPQFTLNLGIASVTTTFPDIEDTVLNILNNPTVFGSLDGSWYWRIRPNLQVDLQQYDDTTADHTFTIGKDIDSLRAAKSLIDTVNQIEVLWDYPAPPPTPPNPQDPPINTSTTYQDTDSTEKYGIRSTQQDSKITEPSASPHDLVDAYGAAFLSKNGDIFTKTQVTINSNYPIETILPGDTVRIQNMKPNEASWFPGILRIVRVKYDGATAVLDLSIVTDNYGIELNKLIGS